MLKRMKATVFLLLCILLLLAAPGTAYASSSGEISAEELQQTAEYVLADAISICMDENAYNGMMNWRDAQLDAALISAGYPITAEDYKSFLASWRAGQEECGAFVQSGDLAQVLDTFQIEKDGSGFNLTGEMEFAQRTASVTFSFTRDGSLKALTVGGKYSTGEILKKAGLNTLIGMGTVFALLIVISLLISTFKFIPLIRSKFEKNQTESAVQEAAATAAQAPAAVVRVQSAEPLKIPDGAVVNVRVRESKVTYVTVRER